MKKLPWLIEPVTGDRYLRDTGPWMPIPELAHMRKIPDFHPPSTWGDWHIADPRWDAVMVSRMGKAFEQNSRLHPDEPIPITATINHLGKSYARRMGMLGHVHGLHGVYFWTHFHRVEPCWVLTPEHGTYKMLTEDELGLVHQ